MRLVLCNIKKVGSGWHAYTVVSRFKHDYTNMPKLRVGMPPVISNGTEYLPGGIHPIRCEKE